MEYLILLFRIETKLEFPYITFDSLDTADSNDTRNQHQILFKIGAVKN